MKDILEIKDNLDNIRDYMKRIDILREDIEISAIQLRDIEQNGKASVLACRAGSEIQERLDMIIDYENLIHQKIEMIASEVEQ